LLRVAAKAETTTDDLEDVEKPTQGSGPGEPSLVLAFAEGRRADPERQAIPNEGLLLGRELSLFSRGLSDDSVSRRHAELRIQNGRVRLHDLGSRNGTWINGKRVANIQAIEPGDVIRVGATLLIYARFARGRADEDRLAGKLIGESDAMAAVRRAIGLVAGERRNVLVTGETGTGKELVAEALHELSGRGGRLVAVNCGAFSEDLLAAELFGHVRGAFTGATTDRPGLFRAAHGGTLFLDELGELPRELQAKLLRALETGRVRPVGSTEEVAVDVAVISATNRDLPADVRDGRFRADLYARLCQWPIALPPLRARREDIPWLLRHLLARCSAAGRPFTTALGEALLLHPWPLNVRGLLNVLSVAALASPPGSPLDVHPQVAHALEATGAIAASAADDRPTSIPSAAALEQALEQSGGSISGAARRLNCSRQQLYRWLEHRGIQLDAFRAK
jgi:DNA-binding NtrC family response regulator